MQNLILKNSEIIKFSKLFTIEKASYNANSKLIYIITDNKIIYAFDLITKQLVN